VNSSDGIPSGKIQFLFDGIVKQSATLDATGAASYTFVGGPLIPGGTHTFSAVYLGALTPFIAYSQSNSTPLSVAVQSVGTSSSLSFATSYINPASQPAGTSLALTATVASTFVGGPTGTVTFVLTDASGGTPVSLTAPLAPASGGNYQAVATYTPTAPVSSGFDVISVVATYGGDANFAGSTSAAGTFNLTPAGGSVSYTTSGLSVTSSNSANGSMVFTPSSQGGWTGLVGFSCVASSLPVNTRCVWAPGQVQLSPSTVSSAAYQPTATLTVAIDQPPQTPTAGKLAWWLGGLTGLALLFARRRWMRKGLASFLMLAGVILLGISAAGLSACNNTNSIPFPTPTGSKTITVLVSADPFVSGTTNSTTQACGINPVTNLHDPTLAPCSQQAVQVAFTIQ
jgi:hypothetical protein